MTTHVNDGGTWRNLISVFVNDGGVWRTIQSIFVNDAGTWRQVFVNAIVSFFGDNIRREDSSGTGPTITASFEVSNNGFLRWNDVASDTRSNKQQWITPTTAAGANYEGRVTVNFGAFTSGSAVSTWISLATNPVWNLTDSGIGSSEVNFVLEIRDALSLTVLDSATFDLFTDEI